MLKQILKQEKIELLGLMIKNELAEMWLTEAISKTPDEIKELDIDDKETTEEQKEHNKKYINYLEKLEKVLEAKDDNLFQLKYIDKAAKKVKKYV